MKEYIIGVPERTGVEDPAMVPAINQRELVRCKDCKHIGDMYKCPVFYAKEKQPDNWFCADGIAKDINVPGKEGR